jgi:predicted homoserine dehydrogenase-like protein
MNLYAKLQQRKDKPLRIGLIGAGKFAAMYIAQVPKTPGVHLVGIADIAPDHAKANLERVGWKAEQYGAASLDAALKERRTHLTDNWEALVAHPGVDIVIEATGNPPAAVEHALAAFRSRKHVVMVTVEADAFCGPLPGPQMAAALRAVHAGDGLGLLRPHARAGKAWRPESEDVQFLPRRLQAGDRDHGRLQCDRAHAGARRVDVPGGLR